MTRRKAARASFALLGGPVATHSPEFDLEPHEIQLLKTRCELVDRAEEACRAVEQEGAYYRDLRGQPKPHPALAAGRVVRRRPRAQAGLARLPVA